MNLSKLYELQKELDKTILENEKKRTGKEIDKDLLLNQTILALQVEVAELANATRCFKHWSTKGAESRERLLDEYADVLHFYLSLGNQLGFSKARITEYCTLEELKDDGYNDMIKEFIRLLITGGTLQFDRKWYCVWGYRLKVLGEMLGFTNKEIEQAYLKKHKENYRRQEEGY